MTKDDEIVFIVNPYVSFFSERDQTNLGQSLRAQLWDCAVLFEECHSSSTLAVPNIWAKEHPNRSQRRAETRLTP